MKARTKTDFTHHAANVARRQALRAEREEVSVQQLRERAAAVAGKSSLTRVEVAFVEACNRAADRLEAKAANHRRQALRTPDTKGLTP